MNWKRQVFENFKLYAVTDLRSDDPKIFRQIEEAYRGGADIVQLRSQTLSDRVLYRLGIEIRKIAGRVHKLFFVNDRLDLALAVHADGLHLGQDDLPVPAARQIAGDRKPFWIGKSTHSLEQARKALEEGPDYIGVGPVFATPTKPTYEPVGVKLVRDVSESISLPFVAIGGIDESNLRQVLDAGARRVAVVRAIFAAENAYQTTRRLREQIENFKIQRA